MRKRTYFASRRSEGWPEPRDLERYFLAPAGRRWFFETRNDSGGFSAEGADGTESLEANKGRIDINLEMWGHPELGVLLIYYKWGGGLKQTYSSVGNLSRLKEWIRSFHGDQLPVGLFIQYERAWLAVKEFIETDGALPRGIEWIANRELPPGTFPDRGKA